MIDTIFAYKSSRNRQRAGFLLKEREQYLSYMLQQGVSKERVCGIASMLLNITRLMGLTALRPIDLSEIHEGGLRWIAEPPQPNRVLPPSVNSFEYVARNWLRFHGVLVVPKEDPLPFCATLASFTAFMSEARGFSPQTVKTYRSRILTFLKWVTEYRLQLSLLALTDVDKFLGSKRGEGCLDSTIGSFCSALRLFFQFTEIQGWNDLKIARGIKSPKILRSDAVPKGPKWSDVRKLLNCCAGKNPADLRAAAIFSLCSIYGIRSGEVVNLTIPDFDWVNETFTVRRVKRGRIQQFPIQFEVGEKILRYLQEGRPACTCRSLIVTLRPPYRPVPSGTLWTIIGPRMKRLGINSEHFGPHSLRHACATQLLKKGSSLKEIADFLGHRDMKSVSVYAKHDMPSLRLVAVFSLAGVK